MDDAELLRQELEQYKKEKERIRNLLGQIGGNVSKKQTRIINTIFIVLIVLLFILDAVRDLFELPRITAHLSLELALILVSVKIIWMIHQQSKVAHFQFWVLSTIEFQVNKIVSRLSSLEEGSLSQDRTPDPK